MLSTAAKTEVLVEALPWIQRYEGKTFVVRYGGAAMTDDDLKEAFAQDVTLLEKIGIRMVIVHGGGKEVTAIAARLGLEARFVNGQRYTDPPMMEVVQMVLAGRTNKEIVGRINRHEGDALGLCGIDGDLLRVKRYEGEDLGLVGEVTAVNTRLLELLLGGGYMPVIAPVGVDEAGVVHNINADLAAAAVATALRAEKLVYLSDVEGVLAGGKLVKSMTLATASGMIASRVISDGMIPKVESAFRALEAGVGKVHMIDGRVRHSLLVEIFTDEGIGTELLRSPGATPLDSAL